MASIRCLVLGMGGHCCERRGHVICLTLEPLQEVARREGLELWDRESLNAIRKLNSHSGGKEGDQNADRNMDRETRLMKYQRKTRILWEILLESI